MRKRQKQSGVLCQHFVTFCVTMWPGSTVQPYMQNNRKERNEERQKERIYINVLVSEKFPIELNFSLTFPTGDRLF